MTAVTAVLPTFVTSDEVPPMTFPSSNTSLPAVPSVSTAVCSTAPMPLAALPTKSAAPEANDCARAAMALV